MALGARGRYPTSMFVGILMLLALSMLAVAVPNAAARQAEAFRRVVDRITAIPAGKLKAENSAAVQHGAEIAANGEAARRTPANPTLGAVRKTADALAEGGVGGPAATPVVTCN
jgi:hypothetical protein